jgi:hypothetical protein
MDRPRAHWSGRAGILAVLTWVVVAVGWPGVVTAQSTSGTGVRLPQDACELVTTEELSAIDAAVLLTLAIGTPGGCNYAGSPPSQPFAGAFLTVAAKPASLAEVALGADARDVTIAGVAGRVSSRDVIAIVGPWLLRINGIVPVTDPAAWLVAAADRAIPRLAALAATDAQGPICSRFGTRAAGDALGVPIVEMVGMLSSCTWATDAAGITEPGYVNVDATVLAGDLASAGIAFKDHELVDVDGREGAWLIDERRLIVDSGQGGVLQITFVVAPDDVATKELAVALAIGLFNAGVA